MRGTAAVATAGMLSAVMLLTPGCGQRPQPKDPGREEPVRRAVFRSLLARDFLSSCPGGAVRAETLSETARFEELKQLALRKGAEHAIWLGQNDYAAFSPHAEREACAAGDEPYRQALAAYGGTLDQLAGRVAEYRP
jgi:hypothetical protein